MGKGQRAVVGEQRSGKRVVKSCGTASGDYMVVGSKW